MDTRCDFSSLSFRGTLFEDILNARYGWTQQIASAIEESWSSAPDDLIKVIQDRAKGQSYHVRASLWELYLWEILSKTYTGVVYEPMLSGTKKKFDFQVSCESGYQYLIEATTIGPNENELVSGIRDSEIETFEKMRKALKEKLPKLEGKINLPTILAISDSNESSFHSRFEKIQILYGRPAMFIDRTSGETSMGLSDFGFWHPGNGSQKNFDAILFGAGYIPGFSSSNRISIWLNPIADMSLEISEVKLEADFYKSEVNLFMTNKELNFVWHPVDIF